jgi:hypothetical protein
MNNEFINCNIINYYCNSIANLNKKAHFGADQVSQNKISCGTLVNNPIDEEPVIIGEKISTLKGHKDFNISKLEVLKRIKLSKAVREKILNDDTCILVYTPPSSYTYCSLSSQQSVYLVYYNCETGVVYGFVRVLA